MRAGGRQRLIHLHSGGGPRVSHSGESGARVVIDGSVGRGRCEVHGVEAHFTCPRCGAFTCAECRAPPDSTQALLRTVQVACRSDGPGVAAWCARCLSRPSTRRALTAPLVAFGALLVGLTALLLAFAH